MHNSIVNVNQIIKLKNGETDKSFEICGIYKIRGSLTPFTCAITTLARKFNFTLASRLKSSGVPLFYLRLEAEVLGEYYIETLSLLPPRFITPAGNYLQIRTVQQI